jgi:hypothetical protein
VFDLGSSGGADVARDKDEMVAAAFDDDFSVFRFGRSRREAFEVLR